MDKNSFLFYLDYEEHLELLTDEQIGQLIKAMIKYEKTGDVPELNGMLKMAFSFIKTQLDKDREKYNQRCEKNKENGAKGGRPKKQKSKKPNGFEKSEGNFQKPKKADNENDNDNDIKENIKEKYGEFKNVSLTDEEYKKIKILFPNDYGERIQKLDDYIQSKGTQYKDFVATLRNWARREGYKFPDKEGKNEKPVEIDMDKLTQEEYGKIVRGVCTYEEIMRNKEVQNE